MAGDAPGSRPAAPFLEYRGNPIVIQPGKSNLKQALGELPWTAEIFWKLQQQGKPLNRKFSLEGTRKRSAEWISEAQESRLKADSGKSVFIFSTLRYWIEHSALMSVALAGEGHQVSLAYLPYPSWQTPINHFDLRRHNAYAGSVLSKLSPLVSTRSFLDLKGSDRSLPSELVPWIEEVTYKDVQYTLQVEEVPVESELHRLRRERNFAIAGTALAWLTKNRPDVLLTPNGSILEMGVVYQVARFLGVPTVTYEFGEQRGRIWISQGAEVMRQVTDEMWESIQDRVLSDQQLEQLKNLLASRQQASLWENFSRRWQNVPSQGGERTRWQLGLDERPMVLLAVNVIGDSLTLGRQLFTRNMTEWLEKTIQYFAGRPDLQLVIRIHPGERYTKGPSVSGIVERILPIIPENIHLVLADNPINTYDLVEIADLGLVYTTTVGLEMAMSGVPVIVAGQTHYRAKGFTIDPQTWEEFAGLLDRIPQGFSDLRPSTTQIEQAWKYAYCFFFLYPAPFPWHLLYFFEELQEWPVKRVLSYEGQARFGDTFRYLVGEGRKWNL
jgi:hypothetical protein